METKSDKVRVLVQQGKFKEALSIVKTFKLGFSKQQRELFQRAHEAQWNPAFYTKLGHNPENLLAEASAVLSEVYGGVV